MRRRAEAVASFLGGPPGRWGAGDAAALAVAALAVLARWGDRARVLLSWDANTFAIALEDYDVRGLHPHAPGYPLFVALGRLANLVWADANDAYVAVSLACTAAACAMGYALGRRLADRATGLAAMALLLAAPLVYVHSVTANVYTADLACSLAVAWAAWACHREPTRGRALALGVVFAVAVGVRPSVALFLAPVAAWGALRPPWTVREQARRLAPAAGAAVAVGLAWFLPMAHLSGGVASWSEANRLQGDQVVFASTAFRGGWPVLRDNLGRLALYFRWELRWLLPALAALALLAGAAALLARRRLATAGPPATTATPLPPASIAGTPADAAPRTVAAFLAAWTLPALLFYATVFSGWNEGPSGYALVLLPGVALASALAGRWAARRLARHGRAVAAVAAALALAVPVAGLASHAHDVRDVDYRAHDRWAAAWGRLPEAFPPENTSIVASYEFAHVWYAFPEYTSYNYRPPAQGPGETPDFLLIQEARGRRATPDWYDSIAQRRTAGPHPLHDGVEALVLFDFQLAGENGGQRQVRPDVPVREGWLPGGWRILYVQVTPDRPHLEDYFTLEGALGLEAPP